MGQDLKKEPLSKEKKERVDKILAEFKGKMRDLLESENQKLIDKGIKKADRDKVLQGALKGAIERYLGDEGEVTISEKTN